MGPPQGPAAQGLAKSPAPAPLDPAAAGGVRAEGTLAFALVAGRTAPTRLLARSVIAIAVNEGGRECDDDLIKYIWMPPQRQLPAAVSGAVAGSGQPRRLLLAGAFAPSTVRICVVCMETGH